MMSEKGGTWVLKLLAVLSAVALGACYVVWKAGEAETLKQREAAERNEAWGNLDDRDRILIPSSKSLGGSAITSGEVGVFIEGNSRNGMPSGWSKERMVFPGSKSFGPVFEIPDTVGNDGPIRVLPGSKSINFRLDNPTLDQTKQEP